MSNRLDQERESTLQPKRLKKAIEEIEKLGKKTILVDDVKIVFMHKNSPVTYFPYSGWATGKTIKDGRGLQKLLKQLK